MQSKAAVNELLSQWTGQDLRNSRWQPLGGGSINTVFRVTAPKGDSWCCKLNSATKFPHLFACEAAGLQQLQPHARVPGVLGVGATAGTQVLLLEWIEPGVPSRVFWRRLGEQLAALHQAEGPCFGAATNNYMGALPQQNDYCPEWNRFFAERRLLPLARKALDQQLLYPTDYDRCQRLSEKLEAYFPATTPRLLHGDLWSGNILCTLQQQPVLIDPATYYGHPSVDLAMTTLFGGFDPSFYEAYQYHAPFPSNYQAQWDICNLYPLLVHLLLFGSSYHGRVSHILERYGS